VRHHLGDVLASAAFSGSKRAQDFLQLVVGHALKGEFDSLRERMIGAEMFGRPIGYDTGSDSVVRVKATEVRKKLTQYYSEAENSRVRIELPSGSYVPRFCFDHLDFVSQSETEPTPSPADLRFSELLSTRDPRRDIGNASETSGRRSLLRRIPIWPDSGRALYLSIGFWLGLAVLVVAVCVGIKRWYAGPNATSAIHSVAILPLENHSGVPAQEYFADGMTKELVSDLGEMSKLRVAPVASTMSYKGTTKSLQEIARELSVDGVVQGSVLREGSLVLISVRLIDARTNEPIWMHTYVRDLTTALAWQGEVAQAIAKEINLGVTPQAQARFRQGRPIDSVAQDLYLHGKYLLEAEDCTNAADYFRAAINVSFNYPQAQASLAFCDGHLGETDRIDSVDAFSMQKIEAAKAVELDDSLADGHAELANAAMNLNWDWATAATEFRRALALSPKSASIHEEYERYLVRTGRVRETLAEIQRNEDMDPFSSRLYHLEGSILYYCRQYDEALLLIQKVRTLDIPPPNWHFLLAEIYAEKGSYANSIAEFSRAGSRPQAMGHLGNVYARAGQVNDAMDVIPKLEETVRNEGIGRYEIALVYTGLGKKDEAFKWLEEAYKVHDEGLTYLKIDPCLDPLRSDPRFDDLLS
jgi:TolB-like protein